MNEKVIEKTEEVQEQEAEVEKSPYEILVEELNEINIIDYLDETFANAGKWVKLCAFALENLQQLYGLWLSTAMAGETLEDRIKVGKRFLPSALSQKNLVDEAARRQAVAQAKQFQAQSGLAVPPPGTILKPTKRGRRGRKL